MIKLVIFDIDGTLVDAYQAVHESLNYTLTRLGYPIVSFAVAKRAVGWGDKKLVGSFVRQADFKKAVAIYRRHHAGSLVRRAKVLPGASGVLQQLKKRGVRLAVASNRPLRFSNLVLRHLGLREYFDIIACARNAGEFKPNPHLLHKILARLRVSARDTVYVGDMVVDVEAGRNAGIPVVAVSGGSSARADLRKARPWKIIRGISKLTEVV